MTHRPLTRIAHEFVAGCLSPGDLAVDATVGNGHDTLFLARTIVPGGQVFGFDIQQEALDAAHARLDRAGLIDAVTLCRCGHEKMRATLPDGWPGRVGAVMFNLGYLPGGDRRLITRAQTTIAALGQALTVLRPGGVLSVLLYRGHAGADAETTAVTDWIAGIGEDCRISVHESPGPALYLLQTAH